MRKYILILFLFPILAYTQTVSYIADPDGRIRNHNVDFTHLLLELTIDANLGSVAGVAHYTFIPKQQLVDSVFLDAPGILINAVTLDEKATRFKKDSAGVTVFFNPALQWETEHTLQIDYTATPKKGLYFIGWNVTQTADANDPDRIRNQIWSQGQGTDNRFWIPGYDDVDDKLVSELIVTFDKNYTVISNGKLISETNNRDNKTKTWHYAMSEPHAFYLIQLSAGEYDHKDYVAKSGVVSKQFYYPGKENTIESTYGYSDELMDWMENEIGVPYPWGSYANVPVQEFLYGAMENTTATIFTDYYMQDEHAAPDRNYYATNAHELTHQWFGDYITEWNSTNHWLHESFATHYAKKFMEYKFGEDFYQWKRRDEMISAFGADANDELPIAHSKAGSSRHYPKGSLVLDMLRYVVGDAQYRKVITAYLEEHKFQNVSTYDLYIQFVKTLGINLDWFFDEWIYKGGYPEYNVSYISDSANTEITVLQTQKQTETVGLFKMPIIMQVHYTDGSFDEKKVWVEEEKTMVEIPNSYNKEIAFVLFDPNSQVYAAVSFRKEYKELVYQTFNAPNMMDRFDALTDMRNIPIDTKRNDLVALYNIESWYGIKSEILFQLANDEDKSVTAIFKSALNDSDVMVRRAAIGTTTTYNKKLQKDYEKLLPDFNYFNTEIALRTLCKLNPDKTNHYLELTKDAMGVNKNIRIAWIEMHGKDGTQKMLDELVNYAGPGYEFRTRNYAFNAIVALNYCDENLVKNLFNGIVSFNYRLASPSRNVLKNYRQQSAFSEMINKVYKETNWTEYELKRIGNLME